MNDLPQFTLTVSLFLYFFGAYLLFFMIYSIFNVYHLMKYGVFGSGVYVLITLFVGGAILLVATSLFLLTGFDWNASFSSNQISDQYNIELFPKL